MALDAPLLLRRQAELETGRANFDSHWQEVGDFVMPNSANFVRTLTPGEKRMQRVFDSTPISANERFAAAMQSMLTPATQRWHSLVPVDPRLEDSRAVRRWCDDATDVMFACRYASRAQFGQAISEAFLSFGAYGNAVIFVDENVGQHLVYRAGHPSEHYFCENEYGVVDTMHRKFSLRAHQALSMFGAEKLPAKLAKAATETPDTPFDFLHVVQPARMKGYAGGDTRLPFSSCYIAIDDKAVVREAGYRTFPFAVGRYQTGPGEQYGRGPGITALPDIKMLNEMQKTILRAAHLVVSPPLLLPHDGVLAAFQMRPGGLNRGGVDEQGRQLVHPLMTGADVGLGEEVVQGVRTRINDIFNVSLFMILVDKPTGMTATEALIRAQEKGALMAPPGQRVQGELLGGMIARELDILGPNAANLLPPMPPELLDAGGYGAIKADYAGPINQAQKAQKGIGIQNFLSSLLPIMEQKPDVGDAVDFDMVTVEMSDVFDVPQSILRSPQAIAALRKQSQDQATAQQAVEAAPLLGAAADKLAKAQATAGSSPNNLGALLQ
jgi:hypothetical protein